jgi:class 3 adenylate cyclase
MRDFDNLSAYLPSVVIKHIISSKEQEPPIVQTYKTVCLFADVSGFTSLSEDLCNMGPEGIEELASQLNKYVGQIVKLTSRAGGDVLKFAGDAMFALWPMEDDDLLNSLQRAIQCGLDMQLRLSNYQFKFHERDADGREIQDKVKYEGVLNVKVGIGFGDVSIVHVGGESDNVMPERYEYVATGPALDEAFASESFAKANMVVVSKAVYSMVKSHFEMETLPDSQKRFYLVKDWKTEVRWKKGNTVEGETASIEAEARVWKYVPAAVLPYLNESNEFWAPELRRVTTLFCSLGFDQADLTNLHPQDVQQVFLAMQRSVFQFEGTINKFLVDDKGSTLIAVFGAWARGRGGGVG